LRQINPLSRLSAGIETWKRIRQYGYDPRGKVFFEVGTGRIPLVPLAYWLMGADRTVTIDLNPYLKGELVRESLRYIADNTEQTRELFGLQLHSKRLDDLLAFSQNPDFLLSDFLNLCQIDYIAPGNAAQTDLPSASIDFHTSYTVLEHIPPEILRQILEEGNRIAKTKGLFVHRIDYSDHFSHSDKQISSINFLQYSDDEWKRYAGNRYMYMNRLRHDDFVNLFQSVGHEVLGAAPDIDRQAQELLMIGKVQLDGRFEARGIETLSIIGAWITSRKRV
jgi:hypothetical protein